MEGRPRKAKKGQTIKNSETDKNPKTTKKGKKPKIPKRPISDERVKALTTLVKVP